MITTIKSSEIIVKINAHGAELISIKSTKTEKEYIWNGNPNFWAKHSPILFPIVGTLKNNSYLYNSEEYHLSRHGFARDKVFEIIQQTDNEVVFSLKSNDETLKHYPFQFELQIKYAISENDLHITYNVFNNNDFQMPFSIGGHPAFALENEFENYNLVFETDETLEYYPLENDLISNQILKIDLEEKTLPLTYLLFEKDALVFKRLKSNSILLKENDSPILNFSFKDFPNFGIWTKVNAPFICLEPWIGYADTINTTGNILEKEAIYILEPKKNDTFTFSITIL